MRYPTQYPHCMMLFKALFGEDIKGVFDSLDDIVKYVNGKKCLCGYKFNLEQGIELGMYKHSGGWVIRIEGVKKYEV